MDRLLACLAVLLVGCGQSAAPATAAPTRSAASAVAAPRLTASPAATTPAPSPTPKKKFPHGLYVVRPTLQHPGGTLEVIDGDGPMPWQVEFFGNGYDVTDDFVVASNMDNTGLYLYGADGSVRQVLVRGIFGLGRPSLSPDAKFAVVQATETQPSPSSPMPKFLTDYVIDLLDGSFRRLIPPGTRDFAEGRELPRWFPSGDRILYQTNEFPNATDQRGCDIVRIVGAASGATVITLGDRGPSGCFNPTTATGPRFHAEVSLDSSLLLVPGNMQIFDARTLQLVGDIRAQALAGLAAAGYKPDARFGGQGGAGTFPLDGTISPDKRTVVFDGAVERDGQFGVIMCRIGIDGSGFTVLRPPVQVQPKFSNDHNYSQLLPRYR